MSTFSSVLEMSSSTCNHICNVCIRPELIVKFHQKHFDISKQFKSIVKAIHIRLADMVYPDGNIIKASAGLCHYANYERLRD